MRNAAEASKPESGRPDPDSEESASNTTNSDTARFAIVEAEAADMRDRWMRSEAEMANLRARTKRELDDVKNYAVQKFAADVVEAAENLRRGLDSIPPRTHSEAPVVTKLREGFLGIEKSFLALLERNGIVKENPVGASFDPQRHEAMSETVSNNHSPGTVLHALSSAWTLNGRLLRPAMVVVAKASETRPTG